MRPSPGGGGNYGQNKPHNNSGVTSSPSKSSSTCSSPSPFSPSSSPRKNSSCATKNSMEEVWKDINLASLQEHPTSTISGNTTRPSFPGMVLQDFLARPFNKDPPRMVPSTGPSPLSAGETSFFDTIGLSPGTLLSLNSGADFDYFENSTSVPTRPQVHCPKGLGSKFYNKLSSSTTVHPCCKKRPQENDGNSDDRRHTRMIKNRESAARSRARKKAYTNELELEVAHLQEENAKLRKQQERLLAAHSQLPKKRNLYRTSTAPF